MNAKISLALLCLFVLVSFFIEAPSVQTDQAFCPISILHPLGCSPLGEDFLKLLFSSTGGTLVIALMGRILSVFLSISTSIQAFLLPRAFFWGYHTLAEALLTIPILFLSVFFRSLLGSGEISLLLSLALAEWAISHEWLYQRINDHAKKSFIEVALSQGASKFFILRKHIIPYIIQEGLILFFVYFPNSLLTISALEFLGFSQNTSRLGLGYLVAVGKDYLFYKPELALLPALVLTLLVFFALYLKKEITNVLS